MKKTGLTILVGAAVIFSPLSYAGVISTSTAFIHEFDINSRGDAVNAREISETQTFTNENYSHELATDADSTEGQFGYNNWIRNDAESGTIKAYTENQDPWIANDSLTASITTATSSINFENVLLEIFENNTEVNFQWSVNGTLYGMAGFGAAMDVSVTNVESEINESQQIINYQHSYAPQQYDFTESVKSIEEVLNISFNLDVGTYDLSMELGFHAASISGHMWTRLYL